MISGSEFSDLNCSLELLLEGPWRMIHEPDTNGSSTRNNDVCLVFRCTFQAPVLEGENRVAGVQRIWIIKRKSG